MTKAIEFKSVTKSFGKAHAVRELSFSLEHGSVYGLLGKNGAGKTTALRMLMGQCKPSSGEIFVYGQKRLYNSSSGSEIGFVPDVPEFYPYMTAREYLALCGQLSGSDPARLEGAIKTSLERVGLKGVGKKRIGGYSRGMKQRLGIAQALLNSPRILLLDEPTSALDPMGRREVMDIIQSLRGEHTVLFSTHILPDVDRVCDSIGVLNNGSLVLEGTIHELKQKYVNQGVVIQVKTDPQAFEDLKTAVEALEYAASVKSDRANELTVATSYPDKLSVELSAILSRMAIPLERFAPVELELESVFMEVLK